jgi:hypothetical protein
MAKEQQLEEAQQEYVHPASRTLISQYSQNSFAICVCRRRERVATRVRTTTKKHESSDEEDFDEDEGDYDQEEVILDPEEEKALAMWSAPEQPRRTLADIIMEKIKEKEMEMAREGSFLSHFVRSSLLAHLSSFVLSLL